MSIFFWGFFSIILAFVSHVLIWRIRIPKEQSNAVLRVFLATYVGMMLLLFVGPRIGVDLPVPPRSFLEFLYISLFHLSLSACYWVTYSAIECESPSGLILLGIEAAGNRGLTRADLSKIVTHELFVASRINGLIKDQMVELKEGRMYVTLKGRAMMRTFTLPREILVTKRLGG